jgi:uncharacterized protein YaiI (UPF0178 family)
MFVVYPPNHACDVYRMLNLKTRQIINSRDIMWQKRVLDSGITSLKRSTMNYMTRTRMRMRMRMKMKRLKKSGKSLIHLLLLKKRVQSQSS